jgi:hypothetical protein
MNAPSPVPLKPDVGALTRAERRSFIRAATAIVLGGKPGAPHPEQIIKVWRPSPIAATAAAV